jgi:hypothetical protein
MLLINNDMQSYATNQSHWQCWACKEPDEDENIEKKTIKYTATMKTENLSNPW